MWTSVRQHPAVVSQAPKLFMFVAQALETEVLSGQTATRVAEAIKALLQVTGTDAGALLQQFGPETQQIIRGYFS